MGQKLTPWAVLSHQLPETACGREIAARDWSRTSLGRTEEWPQSLTTLLSAGLSCPAAMFLGWGPDLTAFFNDASVPILGNRAANAIGQPTRDLLGDIWDQVGPMVEAALTGESRVAVDLPLDLQGRGTQGESWWSCTASPVRDEDGAIAGFLCMSVETTERVMTKRNRDAAAERLQIALSSGDSIGAWDWDVLNNRVTADARFSLIYNVEPERAAAGVPIDEFLHAIHPDDRSRVRSEVESAIQNHEGFFSEYRIVSFSGEEQWISAQGRPVYDDEGLCIRFPGLSFDITANKRSERARRVSREMPGRFSTAAS
jgi:PAS domain-containing protein